jgi:hypothetical protein
MMTSNADPMEVTYTFQFGLYKKEIRGIELMDMPPPTGVGWKKTRQLTANGFRLLKFINRVESFFVLRFSAATGGNEWNYEVRDQGSCSWLHDMGPCLTANKANMPTVSQVIQWERLLKDSGRGLDVSSFRDPYGLKKQQYWPGGNHPYDHIKRGV